MRKLSVASSLAIVVSALITPIALAKTIETTRELTLGQFTANCGAQGGTLSYGMLGVKCTLPNGTSVTCSFVGDLAQCAYETRMAPKLLDELTGTKSNSR